MNRLEPTLARMESLLRIFSIAAIVALWSLFLMIFTDITCRTLLGFSLTGTIEISEYLVVAVCFLPLGYTQLEGGHVRVEVVVSRLSPRVQPVANIVFLLLAMSMFLMIGWQTGLGAYTDWQTGAVHYGAIRLPTWIPMLLASLGCFLLIAAFLTQLLRIPTGLRKERN